MRVVYIDIKGLEDPLTFRNLAPLSSVLTIGKKYDMLDGDLFGKRLDDMCTVISDNGGEGSYFRYRFKLLSEIRGEKLNELGI